MVCVAVAIPSTIPGPDTTTALLLIAGVVTLTVVVVEDTIVEEVMIEAVQMDTIVEVDGGAGPDMVAVVVTVAAGGAQVGERVRRARRVPELAVREHRCR